MKSCLLVGESYPRKHVEKEKMFKILFLPFVFLLFSVTSIAQDNPGPCTCNLTPSACDVNCCCDSDCSAADIQAFTTCLNAYSFASVQSCFPSAIMFRNDTPYSINASSVDGLACIYYDKFTARTYYAYPQVENANVTKLALKAQAYAVYNFSSNVSPADYSVYGSIYKAGAPIHTVYQTGNNPGYLRQPSLANSQLCSYATPAEFLRSSTTSCSRQVTASSCTSDRGIQLGSFANGFRIVPQPGILSTNASVGINFTALTEVTQGQVECQAADGSIVTCPADVSTPSLAASVCSNMLASLTYNIKYESSRGIFEASYDATLVARDVATAYSLEQTFTVSYNLSLSSAAPVARSGNPGYLAGKPVLAGQRNASTGVITVDTSRWLTAPAVNSAGACNDAATVGRRSVAFGEAFLAGCWRGLSLTDGAPATATVCSEADAAVRASLEGFGVNGNIVVGRTGDAVATSANAWLPVLVDNATCAAGLVSQKTDGCVNMLLGGRLDLVTARSGSVTNPQSRLVGARLSCARGNVTVQCSLGSCAGSSGAAGTQRFATSFAVNFIDASSTPTSSPSDSVSLFQRRLKNDFFYLLYVENSGPPTSAPALAGLPTLLVCCCCWLSRRLLSV